LKREPPENVDRNRIIRGNVYSTCLYLFSISRRYIYNISSAYSIRRGDIVDILSLNSIYSIVVPIAPGFLFAGSIIALIIIFNKLCFINDQVPIPNIEKRPAGVGDKNLSLRSTKGLKK
jgi:hypothetical protein